METVQLLLNEKGREVVSVPQDTLVLELAKRMNERHIGAMLVLERGEVVGIVTERDLLTKIVATGRDPNTTEVREIMTTALVAISPETSIGEAMAVMTDRRHRHLPVMRGQELYGIVSIGDLNRWVSRDQAFSLRYLEGYIRGEYR